MKLTLDRNTIVIFLATTIVFGYVYIYINSKQYLSTQGFKDGASADPASQIYPPPNPVMASSTYPDITLPAIIRPTNGQLPAPAPATKSKAQKGKFKQVHGSKERATKEGFWQAGNGPFAIDLSGVDTNGVQNPNWVSRFYEQDLVPTDPGHPNVISTGAGYNDPWRRGGNGGMQPWGSGGSHASNGSHALDSSGNSYSSAVNNLWKNIHPTNTYESSWGSIENNGDISVDGSGNLVENPVYPGEPPTISAAGTPLYSPDRPYTTNQIDDMDGYEYNLVFQNEGDRSLSTGLRQKLMSQRPMDWAGLPPSSSDFQKGVQQQAAADAAAKPPSTDQYNAINGSKMAPPDKASLEEKERQLLQSYVPTGKGQTTYSSEDANKLINQIYTAKGLVPTVAHQDGTNVWQITNTRKVNEPIVYEDETYAPAATGPNKGVGESTIQVPPAATDMAASVDPYFDSTAPSGKTRAGKWNFQEWTPGLERMFAPTEPRQKWY